MIQYGSQPVMHIFDREDIRRARVWQTIGTGSPFRVLQLAGKHSRCLRVEHVLHPSTGIHVVGRWREVMIGIVRYVLLL